ATAQFRNMGVAPAGASTPTPTPTPTPVASAAAVSSLSPASVAAGGPAFNLWLTGTGFASGSVAQWNGVNLAGSIVKSPTSIVAYVSPQQIAAAGTAQV